MESATSPICNQLAVADLRAQENLEGYVFEIGNTVRRNKGVCIVGMSVGNPYFTDIVIERLLGECSSQFSRTLIFIADCSAAHTFQALGYERQKAASKARLRGNALRNKCSRAITKLGLSSEQVQFVDWEQISNSGDYLHMLGELQKLYQINPAFGEAVKLTTLLTLEKRIAPTGVALETAIKFLLEELAFLCIASEHYKIQATAYIYHKRWDIFEKLIAGEFDGKVRSGIGFVIISKER